jgi:drug/metabolite transporter (DMT)-like permease
VNTPKRIIPWNDIGLLATILIWAGNMSIVKQSFASMPPLAFNSVRFFFVPILMLSIVWFVEKSITIERGLWRDAILVGLIGNAGYQVFFMIGLNLTSAATSALLIATTPIWVALISQVRGWEKLSRTGWIGIVISFIGVFVILFDGF